MIPTANRILMRLIPKDENKTQGGLIIPDSVDLGPQLQRGEVVAIGPGERSVVHGNIVPIDLAIGDKIYVGPKGRWHAYQLADGTYLTDAKEVLAKD